MMNPLEAATWWIERYEFYPLPVPPMQKGAVVKGWPDLRLTTETVGQFFNGDEQNIAIIMGAPRNLADVDVDCVEARYAWIEVQRRHGRSAVPRPWHRAAIRELRVEWHARRHRHPADIAQVTKPDHALPSLKRERRNKSLRLRFRLGSVRSTRCSES